MDLSAILAYKALFFANRARNTKKQIETGQKCTALTNSVRCAITASQSVVPLYEVSRCLANTAQNGVLREAAARVAGSNLENIARAMTPATTQSAINSISKITGFLSKLGLVGNISYAAAKCLDAKEEDKTRVFMTATGNCAGMYLFEHIYQKAIQKIKPENIENSANVISKALPKLKSVNPTSIVLGVGFVAASLFGCFFGEKLSGKLYDLTSPTGKPALESVPSKDNNVNIIA